MLKELKTIATNYKFYSNEYWDKVTELLNSKSSFASKYIISFFSEFRIENFNYEDFKLIIITVQALYPIPENQINELGNSFANSIIELSKINRKELLGKRDHLLYIIMDILFHHPEIIMDTKKSVENALFESIIKMSLLKYEVTKIDGDSYFKNYKVIQFFSYFNDKKKRSKIANVYLNHFDLRLKEDIRFEIKEYHDDLKF